MQDISLHIEYLLRYHDCVILPGVGAFLRWHRPACMIEQTGALVPSRDEVCFNSSIISDDGLIAHSISRREGISFEQGRMEVNTYTEAVRAALTSDSEIAIGRIGILSRDSDGILSFRPARPSRFAPAPIMPPAADAKPSERVEGQQSKQEQHSPYYVVRISRRMVRYAAMIAVVLCCCLSLSVPMADSPRTDKASVIPIASLDTPIADKQADTPEPVSEQSEAPTRYYLIVGASHSLQKCRDFIAMHPNYKLEIISSGSNNLISIAAAADTDELLPIMRSEQVKDEFGQSWIYDSMR